MYLVSDRKIKIASKCLKISLFIAKNTGKQHFISALMNIPAPSIEIHLIILYPVNTRPTSPGTFSFPLTFV